MQHHTLRYWKLWVEMVDKLHIEVCWFHRGKGGSACGVKEDWKILRVGQWRVAQSNAPMDVKTRRMCLDIKPVFKATHIALPTADKAGCTYVKQSNTATAWVFGLHSYSSSSFPLSKAPWLCHPYNTYICPYKIGCWIAQGLKICCFARPTRRNGPFGPTSPIETCMLVGC